MNDSMLNCYFILYSKIQIKNCLSKLNKTNFVILDPPRAPPLCLIIFLHLPFDADVNGLLFIVSSG